MPLESLMCPWQSGRSLNVRLITACSSLSPFNLKQGLVVNSRCLNRIQTSLDHQCQRRVKVELDFLEQAYQHSVAAPSLERPVLIKPNSNKKQQHLMSLAFLLVITHPPLLTTLQTVWLPLVCFNQELLYSCKT